MKKHPIPKFLILLSQCLPLAALSPRSEAQEAWIEIASPDAPVWVYRDDSDVSHVEAETFDGIWFGQGYVAARERLWSMDLLRRDARGEFAEIGLWRLDDSFTRQDMIDHDRFARTQRYTDAERRNMLQWLDPELIGILESYTRGVNAYVAEVKSTGGAPEPYQRLQIPLREWTINDTLAIGELMWTRSDDDRTESADTLAMQQKLIDLYGEKTGLEMFSDIFVLRELSIPPVEQSSNRPTISASPGVWMRSAATFPPRSVDLAALRGVESLYRNEEMMAAALGISTRWGGMAWSVSRRKSATGKAMLFSSILTDSTARSFIYEIQLQGPATAEGEERLNVMGMAIAGLPAVVVGANERCAWTLTAGAGNVSDLYIESVDAEAPHRYAFNNVWYDMERRRETIDVWAGPDRRESVDVEVYRTIHGPVLSFGRTKAQAVSIRSAWWQVWDASFFRPFIELNRMRTYDDFVEAGRFFMTSQHLFFANVDGDIGYHWAGRYPIYPRRHDLRLPGRGIGESEWSGIREYFRHPNGMNPRQGFYAVWMNKPGPAWPNWYCEIFRGTRIDGSLRSARRLTPLQFIGIAERGERHDAVAASIARHVARVAQEPPIADNPRAREAAVRMTEPSARGFDDPVRRALYATFVPVLLDKMFADEIPFDLTEIGSPYLTQSVWRLATRILRERGRRRTDYLGGESPGDVLAAALIETVEKMTARNGPEIENWVVPVQVGRFRYEDFGQAIEPARPGAYVQVVEIGDRPQILSATRTGDGPTRFGDLELKPVRPATRIAPGPARDRAEAPPEAP